MPPAATTDIPPTPAPSVNGTTHNDATPVRAPIPESISTMPPSDHHWRITLENKVIAITGANRGIGLGLAEVCLANAASTIYSLDLYEPGPEFQALQKRHPNRLHFVQCNVTDESSVSNAIDTIVSQQGAIHGLIANAGMTKHQPALDFTRSQLDDLFQLNVYGAYFCATAAARKFIELGIKGSIVFTDILPSQPRCTFCSLRRDKSSSAQHDAHACHGVGKARDQS
jgi:short chain dehydrogenase